MCRKNKPRYIFYWARVFAGPLPLGLITYKRQLLQSDYQVPFDVSDCLFTVYGNTCAVRVQNGHLWGQYTCQSQSMGGICFLTICSETLVVE